MKKILVLIFLFNFLFAPSIKAENVLFCQSELVTGFTNDNGTWRNGNFALERFTIKFNDDFSIVEGGLKNSTPMKCSAPYFYSDPTLIHCVHSEYNLSTLRYSIDTKRFVYYFNPASGYIMKDHTDTDLLYAGSCEKF